MLKTTNSYARRVLFAAFTTLAAAAAADPEAIMTASCSGCHARGDDGSWSRIDGQRKTPEGWQMTLARMQHVHGVAIADPGDPEGELGSPMRRLVRHLAATRGLAPAEAAPYRYILEREYNTIEQHPTQQFGEMCARCHSGARVGLQRRSADEWRHLVHFHLGQFPTTEYSLLGRDRDWLRIALDEMVPFLTERFGPDDAAWRAWQAAPKPALDGRWRVAGHMPGRGGFSGFMAATPAGVDDYRLVFAGTFESGDSLAGAGSANVYSGYEWRATLVLDGTRYRQVFAADAGGDRLAGRMFKRDRDEWGMRLSAVREGAEPAVLALFPDHLRAGEEQTVAIVGTGLDSGELTLPAGTEIVEILSRSPSRIEARLRAAADAPAGRHAVAVGAARVPEALTVYDRIAGLAVEPAYAVARVGGNGGAEERVAGIFDAFGVAAGSDGELGTEDDLRVGPLPARWSVEPFDARAAADRDVAFAGVMDAGTGVFRPAAAGPNPERQYGTNNAGNLLVIAELEQEETTLRGEGQLLVTVQRWNNPPIR